MPRQLLINLHLLAVILWLGGMFFAYFCLRPAAAQVLEPPQRLPLWSAVFSRFLPMVAAAVIVILVTGSSMMVQTGFRNAPPGWHVMAALGSVMAVIFAWIYLLLFPRLRRHCAASSWPEAARTLNAIRQLVGVNLALGVATVVAALSAR
ncbi:CopD family protein [Azohydromonas aeria]|uniref:CopD family protein n=1 Tax=Azohydromonas aeria TaxID=2590212 RepID=UPI0012F7B769|nr:CopD family protein [Azohydromonas aeria]